jgi:lysophospholipase L1-like esterase
MEAYVKVTVVAMGNSLTKGFTRPSPGNPFMHSLPYTSYLDNIIISEQEKKGLDRLDVVLINKGMNGDTTRGMLTRMDTEVARLKPDYVIIWGGINGLGEKTNEETLKGLIKLYDKTEELGAKPIACTLTSIDRPGKGVDRITYANELIMDYCQGRGIPVADLFKATSYENGVLRVEFSSDGLHLTARGYQKVAEAIYRDVFDAILNEYADRLL